MPAPKNNQFAKGNKGGRPLKIEPKERVALFSKMLADFQEHLDNFDENKSPIFIENWCRKNGIPYRTLLSYAEANEVFLQTYKECKQIQKELLIKGGLKGYFNPTAFIFTAKNITDMRDQTHTDITSQGQKIVYMPAEILEKHEITQGTKPNSTG